MRPKLVYNSKKDALQACGVSYKLVESEDSIKVRVSAPRYKNKIYFLKVTYDKDYSKNEIEKETEKTLCKKYGISFIEGYTIN